MNNKVVTAYGEFLVKHCVKNLEDANKICEDYFINKKQFQIDDIFGGSECNVLAALSTMGIPTRYASCFDKSELSSLAIKEIKKKGIDTSFIDLNGNKIGEYYFLTKPGIKRENATKYYRKGSSINNWDISKFDFDSFFKDCGIFHISGISFSLDGEEKGKAYQNGLIFIKEAKKRNILVSIDFNYRPSIWLAKYKDEEKAKRSFRKAITPILKYIDIFLLGTKDLKTFLNYNEDYFDDNNLKALQSLFFKKYNNAKLLVIRDTKKISPLYNTVKDCLVTKQERYIQPNTVLFPVNEAIGGGDVFDAGILYSVIKNGFTRLEECANFANKHYVIKHQIKKDMTNKEEVKKYMKKIENKNKKILISVDNVHDPAFIAMKNSLSFYCNVDLVGLNVKSIKGYDIYVGKKISKQLLDTADKLKAIFAYKTGVDDFPLEELEKRNIDLYNSHINSPIIAKYAIGLATSLLYRISEFDKKMRKGCWSDEKNPYWKTIDEVKVGLLGYGEIGKEINKQLKLLNSDTYTIKREAKKNYYENIKTVSSFDELIETCDLIISSLPETNETLNLFNKKVFNKMKGKYLVNVGRNSVVNEKDLFNSLKSGELSGAAIDTWKKKPKAGSKEKLLPSKNVRFEKLDNIILSPHQAMKTKDGHNNYVEDTQSNIINYLLGNNVKNKVDLEKEY